MSNHQFETLIGLLGSSESRVLASGPVSAPEAQGMNASRKREFPWLSQIFRVIKAHPFKVRRRVNGLHLDPGLENHFLDGILFVFIVCGDTHGNPLSFVIHH
jgi:hypothetical protein